MKSCILVILLAVFALGIPKISIDLQRDFALNADRSDFLIHVRGTADLETLRNSEGKLLKHETDFTKKGRFLVEHLMEFADKAQDRLRKYLQKLNVTFTVLWINNMILVKNGTLQLAKDLAKRDDVEMLESNNKVVGDFEKPIKGITIRESSSVEPNVEWIKAPKLWEMGYTGKGVVLAVSDTGVRYTHEALVHNYRGNLGNKTFDHNYNWFDPSGSLAPEDYDGHGTHCMGIAAGGVTRKIGIAPGAKWIACRGLEGSSGVIQCIQWLMAPTDLKGRNPDPDKRPHVSSHSYFCLACRLKNAIDALVESGVVFVKSAGNQGPSCRSITEPGFYDSVVAVAALSQKSDEIAFFSSRGPTEEGKLKPNLAAPGTEIISSHGYDDSRYESMSGTSMAAPHINGAIGLLWSAVPKLQRRINETLDILYRSAKHQATAECGTEKKSPNNVYGYGTVNVLAAYKLAKREGW